MINKKELEKDIIDFINFEEETSIYGFDLRFDELRDNIDKIMDCVCNHNTNGIYDTDDIYDAIESVVQAELDFKEKD